MFRDYEYYNYNVLVFNLQQHESLSVPVLQHPELPDILLIPVIGPRFVFFCLCVYGLVGQALID